jgi:HD-GYP domain-containing protein (c-di-GMP phosphodiesterase class II)
MKTEYNTQSYVLDLLSRLKALNNIGIALSAEKNSTRLLEMILEQAKLITSADGGTLYTRTEDNCLKFEIMLTDTLNIQMGGTSGATIPFQPLPLYDEKGDPNLHMVAVCAAIHGKTINISDAYSNTEFDFFGTRKFDESTKYHSKSFLTVPMKNNEGEVIGVLQLINATDHAGNIRVFNEFEQELVESLASQAAVALVNQRLLEDQRRLFEAFIKLIATATDDKSPYTGEHCRRVPELTMMLADAAAKIELGPLKDFSMTEEERYALKIASWLHDCGKISVPEYIMDKATKLETIYDRVHLIDLRFEVLKRDAEIALLREQLTKQNVDTTALETQLAQKVQTLNEERDFIRTCNIGSEYMSESAKKKIEEIAKQQWQGPDEKFRNFLTTDEIYNLKITKGTLTPEERQIINNHIVTTINMLESLPYPKYLRAVPEYAGGHHERMDGTGYPKGLKREQMSVLARVMGIADVFEALTAKDRPYKKPMKLSEALTILGHMKKDHHIDPDLFDVFIYEQIYLEYAIKYLSPEQIDNVDLSTLPGYNPLQ